MAASSLLSRRLLLSRLGTGGAVLGVMTWMVPDTAQAAPRCGLCGDDVVSRVIVRPPQFTGTVRGPYARYADLGAIPVRLSKESSDG